MNAKLHTNHRTITTTTTIAGSAALAFAIAGWVSGPIGAAPSTTSANAPVVTASGTALTETEAAGLRYMREEEQLAHDVYVALGARWNLPVFANIAGAEEQHGAAVATLLSTYRLDDQRVGRSSGVFADPTVQALYTTLVERGSTSLVEALKAGAEIEELDIADLRARASQRADIAQVYANLERGSRNHLRAFTRQLKANGASYTPTRLSQGDFDAIVNGEMERGPGQGQGQGNGRGNDHGQGTLTGMRPSGPAGR